MRRMAPPLDDLFSYILDPTDPRLDNIILRFVEFASNHKRRDLYVFSLIGHVPIYVYGQWMVEGDVGRGNYF